MQGAVERLAGAQPRIEAKFVPFQLAINIDLVPQSIDDQELARPVLIKPRTAIGGDIAGGALNSGICDAASPLHGHAPELAHWMH